MAGCSKCSRYSRSLLRCLDGFVNPKTIKEPAKAAAAGLMEPCPYTEKGRRVREKAKELIQN